MGKRKFAERGPGAAPVTPRLHGDGELVGAAEGGEKQRDGERRNGAGSKGKASSREIRPPRHLRHPEPVVLLKEHRHETKRHCDHHGEVLRRDSYP